MPKYMLEAKLTRFVQWLVIVSENVQTWGSKNCVDSDIIYRDVLYWERITFDKEVVGNQDFAVEGLE